MLIYRQLDFQILEFILLIIQEASSVLINWKLVAAVWVCPYRVIEVMLDLLVSELLGPLVSL